MTVLPPRLPPRDSGDAWVEAPDGKRYWGRYGAAGLLVHTEAGVLLQHRAEWSHFGGTWGLPGGARHEGESAVAGAVREAGEEAGVPAELLQLAFTSTFDLGFWSYVTVVVRATSPFTPTIGDAESLELRWVPLDEVDSLPLHPGFAASWPALRARLDERSRVVVDAANVIGSRPDGWWRDRAGAAERLLRRLTALAKLGVADGGEGAGGEGADRRWPRFDVVVEGRAKDARGTDPTDSPALTGGLVRLVRAEGSGDDAIVATVADPFPGETTVVTADRELTARVEELGARVRGPRWILELLDALDEPDR